MCSRTHPPRKNREGGNVYKKLAQIVLCDATVICVSYVNKLVWKGKSQSNQKCLSEACLSRLLTLAITKSKERKSKNVCILEVNLQRLGRKNRSITNIRDKKQHTVLVGVAHYRDRMQVSNMFTLKFIFCPSKANSWRLPSISCKRNEPKRRKHMANYRGVKLYKATYR